MRKTLASVLRKTSSRSRPWQIALGVSLGVIAGCAFHSPVLMVACLAIAFWLPVHAIACLTATVASAAIVALLVPQLGTLGEWSLTHPGLAGLWQRIDSLPLVPWLGLHNTVINGACIAGLTASIPFALATLFAARWIMADAEIEEAVTRQIELEAIEDESFVELSPDEMKQLDRLVEDPGASLLDSAASASDASVLVSDEHLRIDLAASALPQPSFPVRTFEVDSLDDDAHPSSVDEKSGESAKEKTTEHKPDRQRKSAFEMTDFQLVEPALGRASEASIQDGKSKQKSPSIYSFDAVARLEELLSGCRVQPHWTTNASDESSQNKDCGEQRDSTGDSTGDGAILRVDDEHRPAEEYYLADADEKDVPTSGEILERSHEIAGLVDQLIATLHDEDDAQPVNELRFDAAHEVAEPSHSKEPIVETSGDQSNLSQPPADHTVDGALREDSTGLQLRFDQIDISQQFARPLYQPNGPSRPDDLKVSVRRGGDSLTREELELQIERRDLGTASNGTTSQPSASQPSSCLSSKFSKVSAKSLATPRPSESVPLASAPPEHVSSLERSAETSPKQALSLNTEPSGSTKPANETKSTGEKSTGEKKSNESLIHLVQRGHDEALRHLLHHLREIEERVRE